MPAQELWRMECATTVVVGEEHLVATATIKASRMRREAKSRNGLRLFLVRLCLCHGAAERQPSDTFQCGAMFFQ